ncbi:MAG: polymerase subunit sigma [Amnibacterium sp.]|nr:polymerase subunit sigma [Amnibacterium sp.]
MSAPQPERSPQRPRSRTRADGAWGMLTVMDPAGDALPGTRDESNEDLLLLVATGDKAAFARLYDATAPRLFGLARRLLIDFAQAEEVTQEVYLEIWQSATRYEASRGSAMAWMLTLAHRRAVDRIRSAQSSRNRDTKVGIRDFDREYDNVAETVEVRIESERVQRALEKLTELQRQAVTLAYFKGLSHSEVAAMLHVPVGTVKTRLRDGMIRLRDEMGVTT